MTKIDALTTARANFTEDTEVYAVLTKMIDTLGNRKPMSPEAKAKLTEKRQQATAAAQQARQETIVPIITDILRQNPEGMTAKDIMENYANVLPADYTWHKVQSVLIRDMKDMVDKIEAKNTANIYRLK